MGRKNIVPKNKITNEEFQQRLRNECHGIYTNDVYDGMHNKMNFYCDFNHVWDATPNSILHTKSGCPVCSNRRIVRGYNDLWTKRPDVAKLLVDPEDGYKYGVSSEVRVSFLCDKCKSILNKTICTVCANGLYCNFCDDGISYPNKMMRSVLNQLNISYIPEYLPQWIQQRFYDFYFEVDACKYIVEMDGGRGHGNQSPNSKCSLTKEESILIDRYKDKCAMEHGIIVIRIDSNYACISDRFDYIKNHILSSNLRNVLNLNAVDWEQCRLDAESSLLFQVSSLWDNGEHNIKNISSFLNINHNTTMRYLKKSEELKTSTYNHFDYLWEHHRIVYAKCIETGEITTSLNQTSKKYQCDLSSHLKGTLNYAGVLDDGTTLHWEKFNKQDTYRIYQSIHDT